MKAGAEPEAAGAEDGMAVGVAATGEPGDGQSYLQVK